MTDSAGSELGRGLAPQQATNRAQDAPPPAASPSPAHSLPPARSLEAEEAEADAVSEFQEVFVGGLPSDTIEQDVLDVFSVIGEVLCVRLNRRRKTGESKVFAFVRYKDQLTAERACREVTKVRGEEVGVHISRPRHILYSSDALLLAGLDSEGGINKLLGLIHAHSDRKAAIAAAIKAVMVLQPRRNGHRNGSTEDGLKPDDDRDGYDDSLPDPNTFLDAFVKCKQLVERFRENPNTSNKTPLAILHEYATRLNLELQYEQNADSNLGPFTAEAKLTSVGGAINYAKGEGRGRSKKEAKQVTAAAVLENLLDTVPMDNFLQSAKKVPLRVPAFMAGRGVGLRGRMRGRGGSIGRYPAMDYLPPFNYPGGQNNSLDLSMTSPAASLQQQQQQGLGPQNVLAGFSAAHSQRLRSYLAQRPTDLEMLTNLRSHSLDTSTSNLQRQLAAGPAFPAEASLETYGNSRSFDNSGFSIGPGVAEAQQEALLRQRQVHLQQQLPSMPEAVAFNSFAHNSPGLFSQQQYHNPNSSSTINFPRY